MMKHNKTFRSFAALLMALMLVVMMTATVVCAEDGAAADTTAADTTVADTTAADTTAADTTAADDSNETDTGKEEKKLGTGFWLSMGVLGLLIIGGVVLAIIKRDKLKTWLKSYKSELKKIVWMPWPQVRKNTIVVIVVVVALSAVIGLLDYVFSKGIIALGNLF